MRLAGQSCISVQTVYVHQSLYDKFVELVVAEVGKHEREGLHACANCGAPTTATGQCAFCRLVERAAEEQRRRLPVSG